VLGIISGVLTLLFVVLAVLFLRAGKKKKDTKQKISWKKKTKEEKIVEQRGTTSAGRLVGDQILAGRVGEVAGGVGSSGSSTGAFRSDVQVLIDRVKGM
jgi:hypothetical protein